MASVAVVGDQQGNGDSERIGCEHQTEGDREGPGTREVPGICEEGLSEPEGSELRLKRGRGLIGQELDLGATSQGRHLGQIRSLPSR